MTTRFCLECENFEDREEIDDTVICAKNHQPSVRCEDFQGKSERFSRVTSKTRFCLECKYFEDRKEIDKTIVCARGHDPDVSCPDFQDSILLILQKAKRESSLIPKHLKRHKEFSQIAT